MGSRVRDLERGTSAAISLADVSKLLKIINLFTIRLESINGNRFICWAVFVFFPDHQKMALNPLIRQLIVDGFCLIASKWSLYLHQLCSIKLKWGSLVVGGVNQFEQIECQFVTSLLTRYQSIAKLTLALFADWLIGVYLSGLTSSVTTNQKRCR